MSQIQENKMSWMDTPPDGYKVYFSPEKDPIFIHQSVELHGTLNVGRLTYINSRCVLAGTQAAVTLGAFCSIASSVTCWAGDNHDSRHPTAYPLQSVLGISLGYPEVRTDDQDIVIGSDVWIGDGARIISGARIGHGCIIGARSVVTGNCEPYGIYAGSPLRLIRKRFDDAVIAQLLDIQWWNWPLEKIRRNQAFFNLDLTRFQGNLGEYLVE